MGSDRMIGGAGHRPPALRMPGRGHEPRSDIVARRSKVARCDAREVPFVDVDRLLFRLAEGRVMGVFRELGEEFEQVAFFHDPPSGLRAIVAIHSTALGPALGGARFYPYRSEADALRDALRLARGMT